MGTAMLTIMADFAQLERDTMIERTRAGLAAAAEPDNVAELLAAAILAELPPVAD